jgi:protein-tyrosine-phosphatase
MYRGWLNSFGKGGWDGHSAGSMASGQMHQKAIQSMKEVEADRRSHQSKSLTEIPQ